MTIAEKLASYAHNLSYKDLNKDAIHAVKRHFLDSLGCAIAARQAPPIKIIKKAFPEDNAPTNALLYGAMIRYLDYNDTYLSKEPAHPADNFGGTLAMAEHLHSKTKDFILASALGYEIQCRLCDAASLRAHGWDHVIYGAVSQALAVGKLYKLNKDQLLQTLNINLSTNISTRQVREATELSMWKSQAFSNVARNAIFFAHLAKNGMTGPNEIFSGKYGFANMLICSGKNKVCSFNINTKSFGKNKSHFKIQDCWLKNWPAEIHSQSVINATLDLRPNIKSLSQIKSIQVESHEAGYTIIGSGKNKWNPKTRETADHSIPYIVSAALKFRDITPKVFSKSNLENKKLLDIVKKVTVKEDKKLTKLYPSAAPNRLTINMKDGKILSKEILHHRGHPSNPMTDKEVEQKFRNLTKKHITKNLQNSLIKNVWKLEKIKFDWGILHKI